MYLSRSALRGLLILPFAALCIAGESFEDFQQSQMQQMQQYSAQEERAFAAWKKEQQRLFNDWQAEAARYDNTSLRSISVEKHSDQAVAKRDVNYDGSRVEVKVASFGNDSAQLHSNMVSLVNREAQKAIRQSDPESMKEVSPSTIQRHAATVTKNAAISVKKKHGAYVAKASAQTDLYGKNGLMQMLTAHNPAAPAEPTVDSGDLPDAASFTSVIVKAQNTGYSTCLIPTFVDESGTELYGPRLVEKEHAINGMVQWTGSLSKARSHDRAGNKPLVITPAKTAGKRRLVFSGKDARMLTALQDQADVLKKCNVVVIVQ